MTKNFYLMGSLGLGGLNANEASIARPFNIAASRPGGSKNLQLEGHKATYGTASEVDRENAQTFTRAT